MTVKDSKYGDLTGKVYTKTMVFTNMDGIKSLEGSPTEVKGTFNIDFNELTSLKYAPKIIGEVFSISSNPITSLEGSPEKIGGHFFCDSLKIKNLKGCTPHIGGGLDCKNNNQLVSLMTDGPLMIEGDFDCRNCPKLEDPIGDIIKYQIFAPRYYTDKGSFPFRKIEDRFNAYRLSRRVTRPSMRKLLGLDK